MTHWRRLNDNYKELYDLHSNRNFLPLCGTVGSRFGEVWGCHHLFDNYAFMLLPTLVQREFEVKSLRPGADHLEGTVVLPYIPYRRGLAVRAKVALTRGWWRVRAEDVDDLTAALEFEDTSSKGQPEISPQPS